MALLWVLMFGTINGAWALSVTGAPGLTTNAQANQSTTRPASVLRSGAVFVSQTPPPATMTPGQVVRVEIRMRNSGQSIWTTSAGFKLGAQQPADNTNWRRGRVALSRSVNPGQTAVFSFEVRAPQAAGDYHFKWRMVQEKVQWFGHPTVDVVVKVSSPTPVLGPNPNPGAWGGTVPNYGSVVDAVARDYPDLLARSCQDAPGGSWEFMDKVLSELRARDRRFGFNCKRGNCNDPSKDGVAYYAGYGDPEDGKGPIVWIDTIASHCEEGRPAWQVFPYDGTGKWLSRH